MIVVVSRTGSPSTTRPARKVVPPTSVEMMLRWPSWRPSCDRPDDAAGEHRADGGDRRGRGLRGRDGAAVALHDQQRAGEALLAQGVLQRREVVAQAGPDLRAHDRRGVAGELADARADLAGQRDEHVRVLLGDELAQALLVGGVAEGPEQRDRDGADAVVEQCADRGAGAVLVEGDDHGAVAVDALGDLQRVPLGQQVVALVLLQDVLQLVGGAAEVAALDVHDEDRVAVALGGEEPDRRHVAHDQRVERGRRAVRDVVGVGQHLGQRPADLFGEQPEDVEHAEGVVGRGGRRLRGDHRAGVVVQHGVGERAAHVHADDIGHDSRSFAETAAVNCGPDGCVDYSTSEKVVKDVIDPRRNA